MTPEELQILCDPARFPTPFSLEVAGACWVGATNGHSVFLYRQNELADLDPPPTPAEPYQHDLIERWLASPRSSAEQLIHLQSLREWAGDVLPGKIDIVCPDCEGTGDNYCRDCSGTGQDEHTCSYCDLLHTGTCQTCEGSSDCYECEGSATVRDRPKAQPGTIAGVIVDRVQLARVLSICKGEHALMCGGNNGLELSIWAEDGSWHARLAAYRADTSNIPVFNTDAVPTEHAPVAREHAP